MAVTNPTRSGADDSAIAPAAEDGPPVEEATSGALTSAAATFQRWRDRRRQRRAARSRRRTICYRILTGTIVVALGIPGCSIAAALTKPGTDSTKARLAEWARDHGLGSMVTWAENQAYEHNQPRSGGDLSPDQRAELAAPAPSVAASSSAPMRLPAAMAPIVTPPLNGEGTWQTLVTNNGEPVVAKALLRPDPSHTSYLATAAWISGKHARFVLHPGSEEPGHGSWSVPNTIAQGQRRGLVATFNGGFRLQDALAGPTGGYYADGRAVGQLPDGYAAEIFSKDGSMTIGQWGRDATTATPGVVAVRENLHLLVDGGQITPAVSDNSSRTWGATVRNAFYVWRTGVGMTSTGDIVFVLGDTLSVASLAALLQRAGAVRAMELDINKAWASFMTYDSTSTPDNPTPTKLADFERPADRYYQPSSRDFVAVYLR